MKVEIRAVIDIPEGFEFDRVDVETNNGDYDVNGFGFPTTYFSDPQIILRKKKPLTRWARMYKYSFGGSVKVAVIEENAKAEEIILDGGGFIMWVGDWQEYTV